jgi:hypothetical protein
MSTANKKLVIDIRHPNYLRDMSFWQLWRDTYEGGEDYAQRYLQKFNTRESDADFASRRAVTPVPAFAKAAINDIRNAVFQRMRDTLRKGGSRSYTEAVEGLEGGVDLRGANMNVFMGFQVLQELCIMGKVGVYVDMPALTGKTLAETHGARPYLYMYPVEDILSWTCSKPHETTDFSAVLLRDRGVDFGDISSYNFNMPVALPSGAFERYRLVYINPETGFVNVMFMDSNGDPIDPLTNLPILPVAIELELTRIPFVMLSITDSLLKDVCKHQVALLNLGSSDVAYALKANFPFYTEQRDLRAVGDHLKHASNADGTASAGGQGSADNNINAGANHGRAYDLRAERPGFIHPSPEPLEASIKLQEKLEDDIRKLVNLAVANKIGRPISQEQKDLDPQGIEAGLAFIGSILENGERKIAEHWASYEERRIEQRRIPVVKYPDRYSLKSDASRIEESKKLSELMYAVPGRTVKKELAKCIVSTLLAGKVSVGVLETINKEIDLADYTTSDPDTIIQSKEAGLVGEQTASIALGFADDEYLQAQEDHMNRIIRIAQAQGQGQGAGAEAKEDSDDGADTIENPASRGVPDLSDDPGAEARKEKREAADTTMKDTTKKPVRGEGKNKDN